MNPVDLCLNHAGRVDIPNDSDPIISRGIAALMGVYICVVFWHSEGRLLALRTNDVEIVVMHSTYQFMSGVSTLRTVHLAWGRIPTLLQHI